MEEGYCLDEKSRAKRARNHAEVANESENSRNRCSENGKVGYGIEVSPTPVPDYGGESQNLQLESPTFAPASGIHLKPELHHILERLICLHRKHLLILIFIEDFNYSPEVAMKDARFPLILTFF